MRTHSSSNFVGEPSTNPPSTSMNTKRRNRRCSKQPFSLEESPVDTISDQRTMAELLRAPTEGYAEAIMVPPILAEHFEIKHSLINMMTSDQFFGLEKDNPHDHIRWFNKITFTIKYKDVPNSAIKLMLFPFSLAGAARCWLKKEPPRSILTWEDLVSKFINEFFPPSRMTNLRNEISNFEQRFGESFHEKYSRYVDDYRKQIQGPQFTKQIDCFSSDVNSSSSSDIAKLTHAVNHQTSTVTTAMTAILKQFQATLPPASVKAVEEICITCSGAHPYYQSQVQSLADLDASINLMPLSVWKKLGLPELISTRMTLELANREICTLEGILRDVFVPVEKFTFPADFVIVDYESNPRIPLILGIPFLRTALALIDVHGEEMILRDGNERLTLNMRHDTSSYSSQPHQESINMIDVYNVSHEEILEDLFVTNHPSGNSTSSLTSHTDLTSPDVNDDIFDPEGDIIENLLNLDKTKGLPPYHDNPLKFEAYLASDSFPSRNINPSSPLPPFHNSLSGSTTSSSPSLPISETSDNSLEEFADELAHFTFLPGIDYLPFDAEFDLREI
ncbi:reverse transcriptase domain-containing protein [Tanacetum coccineum]